MSYVRHAELTSVVVLYWRVTDLELKSILFYLLSLVVGIC